MKFGLGQTRKPTPARMNLLFDLLVGVCGVITGFISSASFISYELSDILTPIITALIIPLLLLFKRFFGAEISGTEVVSVQDATVLDEQAVKEKE